MRLCEIYIDGFGKLSGIKMRFSGGMNVINRENGFGKTTLTAFIRAMLYGLDNGKRQSASESERRRYLPWSGGKCGGSLTLDVGGRIYRIERTFGKKEREDTFKLYDDVTGKESGDYSEKIGEELFGIDEDGFLRTVFIKEDEITLGGDNKTVAARLTGLSGCDGDLSSLDKALALLEDERKIYYKRSGGGEITAITRRISELDSLIGELSRLKTERSATEASLAETEESLRLARAEDARQRERQRAAGRSREKRLHALQYLEMSKSVREDEEKLARLDVFFGGRIPEHTLLEDMKAKLREISTAKEAFSTQSELKVPFGDGVRSDEYDRAREVSAALLRLEGEISALEDRICDESYVTDLPPCDEIKAALCKLRTKKGLSTSLLVGVILSLVSLALGYFLAPIHYIYLLPALVFIIFGAKQTANRKKARKEGGDLSYNIIKRFTGRDISDGDLQSALTELLKLAEARADKTKEAKAQKERLSAILEEKKKLEDEATLFIKKFDGISCGGITDTISEILEKRSASLALREAALSKRASENEAEIQRATAKREVESFLARFKTETESPLDEISEKLIEREAILRALERMRESVRVFGESRGILNESDALIYANANDEVQSEEPMGDIISRLEASRALLEKRNDELITRTAELDGIVAERDSLLTKKSEYESRLSVVTKTKELLIAASDALTARYLEKTNKAFDRYLNLINSAVANGVSMNTSFEIKKCEGGEYKESECYSRGTRDLYALALRLALIESLYEGELPFLILDDPFAHLDDAALAGAKNALLAISREKQIIYLTCAKSRAF